MHLRDPDQGQIEESCGASADSADDDPTSENEVSRADRGRQKRKRPVRRQVQKKRKQRKAEFEPPLELVPSTFDIVREAFGGIGTTELRPQHTRTIAQTTKALDSIEKHAIIPGILRRYYPVRLIEHRDNLIQKEDRRYGLRQASGGGWSRKAVSKFLGERSLSPSFWS